MNENLRVIEANPKGMNDKNGSLVTLKSARKLKLKDL